MMVSTRDMTALAMAAESLAMARPESRARRLRELPVLAERRHRRYGWRTPILGYHQLQFDRRAWFIPPRRTARMRMEIAGANAADLLPAPAKRDWQRDFLQRGKSVFSVGLRAASPRRARRGTDDGALAIVRRAVAPPRATSG